jgi:hypothetical protein
VPRNDVHAAGIGGPAQRRDDVGDLRRHRDPVGGRLDVRLQLDGETAARRRRDLLELREEPVTGSADAAHRVVLCRERVPGAERGQPPDGGFDPAFVDLPQQRPQVRAGTLWPHQATGVPEFGRTRRDTGRGCHPQRGGCGQKRSS